MSAPQKILCPIDLSPQSKEVAAYAKDLADTLHGEITLLYCAPSLSQYTGFNLTPVTIDKFVGEIVSGAESAMDEFIAENLPGAQVQSAVRVGDAAEEIIKAADELQVDLIVMGTHGRKGVDLFLFGSVAEKVVKQAHQPVLTMRPKAA